MVYEIPQYQKTLEGYLKKTELNIKPFYHSDFKDSLENIVFKEEPEREKGLLEKVFTDKTKTLKATIKALFNEVILREQLDSHLLNRINDDMCRQNTQLLNLSSIKTHYSPYANELNNKKTQLENSMLELEKEKRKEYLECWRDLMFMKKYLLIALKDYWDVSKRRNALAYKHTYKNENSQGC